MKAFLTSEENCWNPVKSVCSPFIEKKKMELSRVKDGARFKDKKTKVLFVHTHSLKPQQELKVAARIKSFHKT